MSAATDYNAFLANKSQLDSCADGFASVYMPSFLFDFQSALIEWALATARCAILADCGLGKSIMELVWAENVVRHTNGRVLILTPLGVVGQFMTEARKFGLEISRTEILGGAGIYVANYERLSHYDPNDFVAVVCDESSILKNFDGSTKAAVTEFMRRMRYRLLGTATPSPNDYTELGTSSEALGYLGHTDMLTRFFKNDQNTNDNHRQYAGQKGDGTRPKFRFKGHAQLPFWQWVCSWARALRKPSDLGFDDTRFVLPELIEREQLVLSMKKREGMLFAMPAHGLSEQREERRRTITERCERVAELVNGTGKPAIAWCHLNDEGDAIERLVPDAIQVSGNDTDESKEEKFAAFQSGEARVMVIKPTVGAYGLNWQHCAHQTMFAGYSFEQYYQAVRRSWRFGQSQPVTIDHVVSDGEREILANRQRKALQAAVMFDELVRHMREGSGIDRGRYGTKEVQVPRWLQSTK